MEEQTAKFLNKTFMLTAVLIVGILVFLVGQMMYQSRLLDQQNTNQITVSGEGKVYAKPDVALVNLGVTTQATTVADVTKNNTSKMNAVLEAVKELGIDSKDIQTTNYNLSPNYESKSAVYIMPSMPVEREGAPRIVDYTLSQNIEIKIRDFSKIGDVLSDSTAAGANVVGSLQFTIDNPQQFRDQARAEAIKKAKESAQNIASSAGIILGKLVNVYENYYPYPVYSKAVGMGGAAPDSTVSIPVIEPGQQEINVTVHLTYKVK